jgi:hypothetical protein
MKPLIISNNIDTFNDSNISKKIKLNKEKHDDYYSYA